MSSDSASSPPFEVLIAGGGVAALEAALALRELAGDRVSLKLIAPEQEFVYRPMTVREPFAFGGAQRFRLDEIAADIGFERLGDKLASIDAGARQIRTESGEAVGYHALMLALGAKLRARYEHAITIDDKRLDELLHGLIQDVEDGYVKRLGFVVPPRMAWPLPVYELALMTSTRAYDMNVELQITIISPEDRPLAVFGDGVSQVVTELLADRQIEFVGSSYCEIPDRGSVELSPGGRRLEFARIVALPELEGPGVPGIPHAEDGFIPVDAHCQVRGVERVFAAGDAVDFAVKHGGMAAQQADTAAAAIAALAGADVRPTPFEPVIYGVLLTGGKPRYLRAHITGGHGASSEITGTPSWDLTGKIAAKYLGPYLETFDRARRGS